jgi:hypothetical protein
MRDLFEDRLTDRSPAETALASAVGLGRALLTA